MAGQTIQTTLFDRPQVVTQDFWSGHLAVDLGAVFEPIKSPDNATVGFSGLDTDYWYNGRQYIAQYMWLKLDNGYGLSFVHLSDRFFKSGDRVGKGQTFSISGNSGRVEPEPTAANPRAGAHLHLVGMNNNISYSGFMNPLLIPGVIEGQIIETPMAITKGKKYKVLATSGIITRTGSGLKYPTYSTAKYNSIFEVISDSRAADGYTWANVKWANGETAWMPTLNGWVGETNDTITNSDASGGYVPVPTPTPNPPANNNADKNNFSVTLDVRNNKIESARLN